MWRDVNRRPQYGFVEICPDAARIQLSCHKEVSGSSSKFLVLSCLDLSLAFADHRRVRTKVRDDAGERWKSRMRRIRAAYAAVMTCDERNPRGLREADRSLEE